MTFIRRPRLNRRGIGSRRGSASSGPPLLASQSFGIEIIATVLPPLVASQSFDVAMAAALGGAGPLDPLTIIADMNHFWIGDLNVSEADAAGRVSAWNDQIGSSHWVQATTTRQPAYAAADATLNSRGTVSGDGAAYQMTGGPDFPAPGTTACWKWWVLKFNSFDTVRFVNSGLSLRTGTTANTLRLQGGSNGPEVPFTVGTWYLVQALFNNATTDELIIGPDSNIGTGSSVGNTNAGAETLFGSAALGNFGDAAIAAHGARPGGKPSAGVITDLRTWVASYYGGVVTL